MQINSLKLPMTLRHEYSFIITMLQMKKPRHREVKQLAPGHTAGGRRGDCNACGLTPEPGAAAGCQAGPSALRNELWVPRIHPREDTALPPVTAEETEAQRMCTACPGPHRAPDLESAELPRLCPESPCLTACLTAGHHRSLPISTRCREPCFPPEPPWRTKL